MSDRKATEIALKESQARFYRITENVPGMLYRYVLHPDGRDVLTYVSSQVQDILELELDMVLQDAAQVWLRVHPDDVSKLKDALQISAETLQPLQSEKRLNLPEKGIRWIQTMAHLEPLKNGDVVWDGVVIDMSDHKAAELALKESQNRLRRITENIPGMIFRCVMAPDRTDTVTDIRPIIALNALAMVGDEDRCLAAGADRYMSKPIRLKQLVLMINELLPA